MFRQNQIIRMDYVGGATVFRLSVISPNGCMFMEEQFVKIIEEYSFMRTMDFLN